MDGIRIGFMKVHAVESAASVNIGPHLVVGPHSVLKSVMANGQINGDRAAMPVLAAWVDDPDLIDTPAYHGIWPCRF